MARTRLPSPQISDAAIEDDDGDTKVDCEESSDEDKIRFDTAGSERMIIDDSGNVGIGTTTPGNKLHIYGSVSSNYISIIDNDQGSAGHGLKVTSDGTGSGTHIFDVESQSNIIFRVRGDGKVGIGTTVLPEMLTVGGNVSLAEYIYHTGDSDTYIRFQENQVDFYAGGRQMIRLVEASTDKVTINNGGMNVDFHVKGENVAQLIRTDAAADRVGIGTQNPGALFHVDGDTIFDGDAIFNESGADKNFRVESNNINHMLFVDGGTDTVVIGAIADPDTWSASPVTGDGLHVQDKNIIIGSNTADAFSSVIAFNKSRNATDGSHIVIQSGDTLGEINFLGSDGTNFELAGQVKVEVDDTPGNNDMPGRLVFSTTANGANSLTERMRIDSSGQVGIGTTSPSSGFHAGASQAGAYQTENSGTSINLDGSHFILDYKGTAGTYTVNLPDPGTCTGRAYHILNSSSSNSSDVAVSTSPGNFLGAHIEGTVSTVTIENGGFQSISIISTGNDWFVIHDGRLIGP